MVLLDEHDELAPPLAVLLVPRRCIVPRRHADVVYELRVHARLYPGRALAAALDRLALREGRGRPDAAKAALLKSLLLLLLPLLVLLASRQKWVSMK